MKERIETSPRIDELLEAIGAMAMMAFLIAVNVQFGLANAEDWQLGKGRE